MDIIRFQVEKCAWEPNETTIQIYINGLNLIEIIKNIEIPYAKAEHAASIAGGYDGLYISNYIKSPLQHFLGNTEKMYGGNGKTQILECGGCHEPGCWPFFVKITVNDETVMWSDFEQPHRKNWKYEELKPFVFDKYQYKTALKDLENIS